jgi:hypothetical protein
VYVVYHEDYLRMRLFWRLEEHASSSISKRASSTARMYLNFSTSVRDQREVHKVRGRRNVIVEIWLRSSKNKYTSTRSSEPKGKPVPTSRNSIQMYQQHCCVNKSMKDYNLIKVSSVKSVFSRLLHYCFCSVDCLLSLSSYCCSLKQRII